MVYLLIYNPPEGPEVSGHPEVPLAGGGWTLLPGLSGSSGGLAIALFRRKLDGTEISATFSSASGAVIVGLFNGMPTPAESDLNIEITTASPALWPSVRFSPRWVAQRPLPSITMAT